MIRILEEEQGGYVCSNCHTILDSEKYIPILNEIYDNENIISKVIEHYNLARKRFKIIEYKRIVIENPLKQSVKISDSIFTYLMAIDSLSKTHQKVTNKMLVDYLGFVSISVPRKI